MYEKLLAFLLFLAFALAGCANKDNLTDEESGIKKVENYNKENLQDKKENLPKIARNLDEAVRIFHNHNFGDGRKDSLNIDKFKVEFTNEVFVLKIEGFKNGKIYMLTIDDNAQIIDERIENDRDDKKLALNFKEIIPGAKAMEKAMKGQAKGAWVKGYELKIENGKAVYEIDIAEGRDVKIDATSGEIIKEF